MGKATTDRERERHVKCGIGCSCEIFRSNLLVGSMDVSRSGFAAKGTGFFVGPWAAL